MAQTNVEIVEALQTGFRAGEREDAFRYLDPEIEWDARRGAETVPEIARLYRGHEGVRAYWREWLEAWETIEFESELIDAGDNVVLLIDNQRNRGRHSGIEVEVPPYALVFTLRDAKVIRWAFYSDQQEGLEAAGAARP